MTTENTDGKQLTKVEYRQKITQTYASAFKALTEAFVETNALEQRMVDIQATEMIPQKTFIKGNTEDGPSIRFTAVPGTDVEEREDSEYVVGEAPRHVEYKSAGNEGERTQVLVGSNDLVSRVCEQDPRVKAEVKFAHLIRLNSDVNELRAYQAALTTAVESAEGGYADSYAELQALDLSFGVQTGNDASKTDSGEQPK